MKQEKNSGQSAAETPRPQAEKETEGTKTAAAAEENGKKAKKAAPPGPEKTADPQQELEKVRERLKEAEAQTAKQKDVLLRTAAEYDNYRKRTAREKETVYADATSDAVKEFLPVADNLERALEQKGCSAEDLRKGVEMVEKQMRGALEKLGVTEMGKEGEPFDPALHSAVAHVDDENVGENTVTKVFQKGYKIGDRVVRHAMVQVAN